MKPTDIKTPQEEQKMQEGGRLLARALQRVQKAVKPGISTAELDAIAEGAIRECDAEPSFKGYQGFPATLCVSINDEIVHGIPKADRLLKNGDVVGLDLGLWYKGLCTDMAVTLAVGKISREAKRLLTVTRKALLIGIQKAKHGNTVGDIGNAIQTYAESKGFGVVRELVGHGVGRKVHEEPLIPNFGEAGRGAPLRVGMVIAIEPMLTVGSYEVTLREDGWTYATLDGSLAAQFEHTIAITEKGPIILTQ